MDWKNSASSVTTMKNSNDEVVQKINNIEKTNLLKMKNLSKKHDGRKELLRLVKELEE